MAKLRVPPTKSSLRAVKAQLSVAREGYSLLEQKREILVIELMRMVEEVKLVDRDLQRQVDEAFTALKRMILKLGREEAAEISHSVAFDYEMHERTSRIIGMSLPSIEVKMPRMELKYSLASTHATCDQTLIEFFELLKLIAKLAEIRTMVWRLAAEVKKTQRRVNALEKLIIPQTEETRDHIESVLEEGQRESFFTQKVLKARFMRDLGAEEANERSRSADGGDHGGENHE